MPDTLNELVDSFQLFIGRLTPFLLNMYSPSCDDHIAGLCHK